MPWQKPCHLPTAKANFEPWLIYLGYPLCGLVVLSTPGHWVSAHSEHAGFNIKIFVISHASKIGK